MAIRMILPYPPTVNHYWKTSVIRKGRRHVPHVYIDLEGQEYRKRVKWYLEGIPTVEGLVNVIIVVNPPDKRRRDLDNLLKCLLDSLTHAGLWADDSQVDRIALFRGEVIPGGQVSLVVEQQKDFSFSLFRDAAEAAKEV